MAKSPPSQIIVLRRSETAMLLFIQYGLKKISVGDVMGEEDCSLRNHGDYTTSLGLHPFVKHSKRKKLKVAMGLPGHSFHSENTAGKTLRSPAPFRNYIKWCEKCSQQKPSTLLDVLAMFSFQ